MPSVTLGRSTGELAASVSRADPVIIACAILALVAAAAYAFWRAWRNLQRARLIEDTPTSRARSAPQGYAELEGVGRLMDGPPIVAPLSGSRCVWYRYQVEEQQAVVHRSGTSRQWVTIDKGVSTEVFWLEDDTGRVAIDPEGAEVDTEHKDVWYHGQSARPVSGPFARLFSDILSPSIAGDRRRYTEERIHPGETLYALGLIKNIGSYVDAPNTEEDVRQLLVEWKKDQPSLIQRFDLNRDGKIDEQEWMLARSQARREVLKARREQQMQPADAVNLMTSPNDADRPYLLASFHQQQLATRYRRYAWGYGALFFTAGCIAVWLFNQRFI